MSPPSRWRQSLRVTPRPRTSHRRVKVGKSSFSRRIAGSSTWIQVDEPAILLEKDDFPTFTRLWEVLGRGVTLRLCLHLEGGDIEGIYPGIARLKRLACLSLDC